MDLRLEERLHADSAEITDIIASKIEGYHSVVRDETAQAVHEITQAVLREYLSRGWIRVTMHPIKSIDRVLINGVEVELL